MKWPRNRQPTVASRLADKIQVADVLNSNFGVGEDRWRKFSNLLPGRLQSRQEKRHVPLEQLN